MNIPREEVYKILEECGYDSKKDMCRFFNRFEARMLPYFQKECGEINAALESARKQINGYSTKVAELAAFTRRLADLLDGCLGEIPIKHFAYPETREVFLLYTSLKQAGADEDTCRTAIDKFLMCGTHPEDNQKLQAPDLGSLSDDLNKIDKDLSFRKSMPAEMREKWNKF